MYVYIKFKIYTDFLLYVIRLIFQFHTQILILNCEMFDNKSGGT